MIGEAQIDGTASAHLCRSMLDAIPEAIFVVDQSLRIVDANTTAASMFFGDKKSVLRRISGEVLYCVHSREHPEGCGRSESCQDCMVHNSVMAAMGGRRVIRQKAEMELVTDGRVQAIELFITAAPFEHEGGQLVLLLLENLSEWMAARSLLPMCANCKKIRDERATWHQLEEYITTRMHTDLTHGICPDCARKLYPEFFPGKLDKATA